MFETGQDLSSDEAALLHRRLLQGGRLSMGEAAHLLGISRAALYRRFPNRTALLAALDALDIEGAGTRERLVEAAAELIEAHGADQLSLDDAAARAGVPRATAYRYFSGRSPLLAAVVHAYAPTDAVATVVDARGDQPLHELAPALATALLDRFAARPQLLRALLHEATGSGPNSATVSGILVHDVIRPLAAALGAHLHAQGRTDLDPVLAAQALAGPLILHALSRELLRVSGLQPPSTAAAAASLTAIWLNGIAPGEAVGGEGG
jgi:AcrR family transcriptional regulator